MEDRDLMQLLEEHDAIYTVRKDPSGNRLSPLVGYAGKYDCDDRVQRAYVGEKYYDFARVEQDPSALYNFAEVVATAAHCQQPDLIVGMPMGGIAFSLMLADAVGCGFAFIEKKVTALATAEAREQSQLVIARHKIASGARLVLGEDVCNNFSTTDEAIELAKSLGAQVIAIACAFNRSNDDGQVIKTYAGLPVIAALEIPTPEYRQDDPYVREDIETGNVVWKPKEEWDTLLKAMRGQT